MEERRVGGSVGAMAEGIRGISCELPWASERGAEIAGEGIGSSIQSISDMKYSVVSGIGPLLGFILNNIGTGFVINSTHFSLIVFCLNKIEFG